MRPWILSIITIITLTAEGAYINPATRIRINDILSAGCFTDARGDDERKYEPMLLELEDAGVADNLIEKGVIIHANRSELYLCSVPTATLQDVIDTEGVKSMASAAFDVSSCIEVARPFANVDDVHSGRCELPQSYDGTGIVVGFSDIGFDATQIAFKDKVSAIYHIDAYQGTVRSATTREEIAAWTTDAPQAYHATHVANILAGNYRGNDYYGVATGAEIVATTSPLDYVSILTGVEKVIAYAKQVNKPAVVNLSLSDQMGPRDGTDLICRYLTYCSEDAIICISAGNTGHMNVYAGQDLWQDKAEVTVSSYASDDLQLISGLVDIWSDGDEPFEYRLGLYDSDNQEIVYTSEWVVTGDSLSISPDSDEILAKYFEGKVVAYSDLSPRNNRYNVTIGFNIRMYEEAAKYHRPRYFGYVSARACEGARSNVHVDIFRGSQCVILNRVKGSSTVPGSEASINNMCCADGVLSIGMATTRNTAPSLNRAPRTWNVEENHITRYTSYNIVDHIKPLPHFAAPGCYLISAISSYYIEGNPATDVSAVSEADGKKYYWYADGGTSMAAPFTAGIVALWLQADNSLTASQVLEIAQSTARTDFDDIDDPRWGAGCIDALAGIKMVAQNANIIDIEEPVNVSITSDRRLKIEGTTYDKVKVHTISGIEVNPRCQLEKGVYVISAPGNETIKILVK